jgi:hypothetical protein
VPDLLSPAFLGLVALSAGRNLRVGQNSQASGEMIEFMKYVFAEAKAILPNPGAL